MGPLQKKFNTTITFSQSDDCVRIDQRDRETNDEQVVFMPANIFVQAALDIVSSLGNSQEEVTERTIQ